MRTFENGLLEVLVAVDIGTLSLVTCIVSVLQVAAFYLQSRVNRIHRGLGCWTIGSALAAAGFILFVLRETVPIRFLTIVVANTLLIAGPLCLYAGVERFNGRRERWGLILGIMAAFLLPFLWFTYGMESITARTAVVSVALAAVAFLTSWSLVSRVNPAVRASATFSAVVALAYGVFFILRAVMVPTVSPITSFFTPVPFQALAFIAALLEGILLTFGFIIMVNQRLNAESSQAKERFELLFNTNPDPVLITRLRDGMIVQVNDAFVGLGFTREAVIGRTVLEVPTWEDPGARARFAAELGARGSCESMEAVFHRGDGSRFFGIISGARFMLGNEPHVVSVTRDISQRKTAEEALEAERNELRRALDEVKTLRGLLPICSHCKKIRDDSGSWNALEQYVADHSDAEFTHGICPDCMQKLYPELVSDAREKTG
jgi:PAS domain S-box-containing protein